MGWRLENEPGLGWHKLSVRCQVEVRVQMPSRELVTEAGLQEGPEPDTPLWE